MSFASVVGHEAAKRLLAGQIRRQGLPHSILFIGLSGIGKKTLAIELAKVLQCETQSGDACDRCDACQRISQGTYPDLLTISPDSETGQIGIDSIRILKHLLELTPHSGRWKIGIVDGADSFTEQAAHACLKLLEEPPVSSLLMLTASAPYHLPATLVSRCALIRCFPQGIQRVTDFLHTQKEVASALARTLATLAGGRLGEALRLLEGDRLMRKNLLIDQLIGAFRSKNLEVPLAKGTRKEVEEGLTWWAAWWRDLLVLQLGGDPQWLIHQDRLEDLRERFLKGHFSPNEVSPKEAFSVLELLNRVERATQVQEALQANASPRIALAAVLSS